jgi:MFS family permease
VTARPLGTLAALTAARIAFGYQFQTVASLGPELVRAFHMEFALLGTLVGLYMLPGVALALPAGFAARRFGDRAMGVAGLLLMTIGSAVSAMADGPGWIGVGRVIAGSGAVSLTVLQGKIVADRYSGHHFTLAMGLVVGAFPLGLGLAQLTQGPLAAVFGWPAGFLGGSVLAGLALVLFLAGWSGAPHAAARMLAWPSRRECLLVVLAAVIWTAYNAGYANFLAYLPSYLVTRGHSGGIADLVVTMATWGNLPAILLGGALATRLGPNGVFVFGTVATAVAVIGIGIADWPLLWGGIFGTVASVHAGLIVQMGTLSAQPQNRAVGMGIFYTIYYSGGAGLPALCGKAADVLGDPAGAFLCAGTLSALALPAYVLHRRASRVSVPG